MSAPSPRVEAYRAQLIANGVAAEIADITIERLLEKGEAQKAHNAELRAELALIESAIAVHHEETRSVLEPLEADVTALADATTRAVAALDAARIQREAHLASTLGARRLEIIRELSAPHAPAYRSPVEHAERAGRQHHLSR